MLKNMKIVCIALWLLIMRNKNIIEKTPLKGLAALKYSLKTLNCGLRDLCELLDSLWRTDYPGLRPVQ